MEAVTRLRLSERGSYRQGWVKEWSGGRIMGEGGHTVQYSHRSFLSTNWSRGLLCWVRLHLQPRVWFSSMLQSRPFGGPSPCKPHHTFLYTRPERNEYIMEYFRSTLVVQLVWRTFPDLIVIQSAKRAMADERCFMIERQIDFGDDEWLFEDNLPSRACCSFPWCVFSVRKFVSLGFFQGERVWWEDI
jgi:hypothetical protein